MSTAVASERQLGSSKHELAHKMDWQREPFYALCGKPLRGVVAPFEAPLCVVCGELYKPDHSFLGLGEDI
jgi:hypothetical protein